MPKLEQIRPMADCLEAYYNSAGTFGRYLEENKGEELVLSGITTCGGCKGNSHAKLAQKRIDNMLMHGVETVFMSSCLVRQEFFPKNLEDKPVDEVENTIRICLFSDTDPHGDHQAHEVACALCAGHLSAECPNNLPEQLKEYLEGKAELVSGTHFEHLDARNLNPVVLNARQMSKQKKDIGTNKEE